LAYDYGDHCHQTTMPAITQVEPVKVVYSEYLRSLTPARRNEDDDEDREPREVIALGSHCANLDEWDY
jgi:hypothetical protein